MALNGTPLINGVRHSWASIEFLMLGRIVTGISEIKYKDSVSMEDNRGAGNYPVSRGIGDYTAEASIKLEKYEVEAIADASAGLRIQEIPAFDIVVAYRQTPSDPIRTDVIKNVQFKTNMRDMKTGDTKIDVAVDLITSHIEWQ